MHTHSFKHISRLEDNSHTAENNLATSTIKQVTNNSGSGYCKMPDGTLICYGDEATGSISSNSIMDVPVTFPLEFLAVPVVTVSYVSHSPAVLSISYEARTKTGFTIRVGNSYSSPISTRVTWIAVGRWK